jgi:hypothetical protein
MQNKSKNSISLPFTNKLAPKIDQDKKGRYATAYFALVLTT